MIIATDLDRTMIFSRRCMDTSELIAKNYVCVEKRGEQEISYMTKEAVSLLDLLQKESFVIPVTARSKEQFDRIVPFKNSRYAITGNGTSIWENGKEIDEWKQYISGIILKEKKNYKHTVSFLDAICFEKSSVLIDNAFFFAKSSPETFDEIKAVLEAWVDEIHWNLVVQGFKMYLMPGEISKENALSWLLNYLPKQRVLTAGDGAGDYSFMQLGEAITPKNSELYLRNKKIESTINSGILAGEEILRKAVRELHCS